MRRLLYLMTAIAVLFNATVGWCGITVGSDGYVAPDYSVHSIEVYVQNRVNADTRIKIAVYDSSGNLLCGTNDSGELTDGTVCSMTMATTTTLTPSSEYYVVLYQNYYVDLYSESDTAYNRNIYIPWTYSNDYDDPLDNFANADKEAFQFKVKNLAGEVLLGTSSFVTTYGSSGTDQDVCYSYRPTRYVCNTL